MSGLDSLPNHGGILKDGRRTGRFDLLALGAVSLMISPPSVQLWQLGERLEDEERMPSVFLPNDSIFER
jgi:hypothetical protein